MNLKFKRLFLSAIAFVMIIESFEVQAMQDKDGFQRSRKRGRSRPVQQRKQNITLKTIKDDPDLPSRFIRDNNPRLPYNLFLEEDRMAYLDDSEGLFNKYMPLWDGCFLKAKGGDLQAAEWLSKFYQSFIFCPGPLCGGLTREEAEKNTVRSYDIAKKFAKSVAEGGGNPKEYIYLTGLGYGAKRANYGKEMKECTKWMIKDFLKHPYDPKDPNHFYAMINSGIWEPRYVDQKSLASLNNYIANSYHKNGHVRLTKALMLWKGFFGETENNNERAFRIACQECVLNDQTNPDLYHPLGTAGNLLFDIAIKCGYNPENNPRLNELWKIGVGKEIKPLQIIQQSTRLLQYYKVVPEQITQQLRTKKRTLRLDLHGKGKEKSVEEVMQFLNYMTQDKDIKYSIIITGRGNHSPGHTPILKPFVQNVLKEVCKEKIFLIEYQEDSGEGAFRVWMQS